MNEDDLLTPPPPTDSEERLRGALLSLTARRVRRRKWVRRCVHVGSLALCAAAGALGTLLLSPDRVGTRVVVVNVPVPEAKPEEPPKERVPAPKRKSPSELEVEAEQALVRADAARIFREAGDLYLLEERNARAALRCYRHFLDDAESNDLEPRDGDTWLLTSLKNARRDGDE